MKKLFFISMFMIAAFAMSAQDAAEKITAANEALQGKDYAKAFELYDDAMKNIGDVQVDKSINYNVGFAAYKANKFEDAIKYFDVAIEAGANVAKCHEYKANAYNKLKDYPNAVASYEKAMEASGSSKLAYNAAIAAYKSSSFEKASGLFDKCIEEGNKIQNAYYYKALSQKKLGDNDMYKTVLAEGAEKFPADKKLGPTLAKLFVSEGNGLYKKGVEILNAANQKVNAGTMSTEDAAYTAEVDKAKAEFKAAAEVLEKAVKYDASNANASKLLDACKQNLSL